MGPPLVVVPTLRCGTLSGYMQRKNKSFYLDNRYLTISIIGIIVRTERISIFDRGGDQPWHGQNFRR